MGEVVCRNRHTVSVLLLRLVAILLRQYFRDTGSHLVTIQSPLSHFLGEEARLTLTYAVFCDQVLDNGVLAVQIQSANGAIQVYRRGLLSLRAHPTVLAGGGSTIPGPHR